MSTSKVELKKVAPLKVAAIRDTLPNYPDVGPLFDEVLNYLKSFQGVKIGHYYAAIWHDYGYKERDVDGEAIVSVESLVAGNGRIKVYELPGFRTMACMVHYGSYNTLSQTYTPLLTWIEDNNYKIVGPNREVYLVSGSEQDNPSYVTEVQFPVEN